MKRQLKSAAVENKQTPYTTDEALVLIHDYRLTKDAYHGPRLGAKARGYGDMYPTYDDVLQAKKECYPNLEEITEL